MKYLASFTLLLAVFVFCSAEVMAQAQGPRPAISRVEVVYNGQTPQTLNIFGSNFGTPPPIITEGTKVSLDGTELTVISFNDTMITANMTPERTFGPGTYLLRVIKTDGKNGTFDVTLGAQGPEGPQGPQG